MKIARHVGLTDHAFLHRDKQVTYLRGSAFIAFHENTGALYGSRVHLTCVRLKSSHQIQVDTGTEQVAIEEGRLGRSAGAEYVGFRSAGCRVGSCDRQACLCGHSLREVPARLCVPAANQNLLKAADVRNDFDMCPRLPASSEYSQNPYGFAGQEFCRDSRCCRGAQIGEIVCRHDCQRSACLRVKQAE